MQCSCGHSNINADEIRTDTSHSNFLSILTGGLYTVHRSCGKANGVASTAVTQAGDMSFEDLVCAEWVAVRASGKWFGNPLPAIVRTHTGDSVWHQVRSHS